jgi:hypothetical protein
MWISSGVVLESGDDGEGDTEDDEGASSGGSGSE